MVSVIFGVDLVKTEACFPQISSLCGSRLDLSKFARGNEATATTFGRSSGLDTMTDIPKDAGERVPGYSVSCALPFILLPDFWPMTRCPAEEPQKTAASLLAASW